MNNKIFCVISHTHWDREWYMPLENFRIRLVDLIDNLLEILADFPEYIFHLDAQTIVIEDYLQIRPYKKELLKERISEGRLLIGPWYVQNDFYLTSGEATIRNLMIGSQIAEDMGKCTWVGYTPDQFGLISQLPQIFKGFGIDNCVFGRGYSFFENVKGELVHKPTPSELIWEGADGSKVLGVLMPYWYNNAQRFSEDINKSLKYLEMIEKNFDGVALTPYLLLMNGVDHLEAQENLIPILTQINEKLHDGKKIEQYKMDEYINKVKDYIDKNDISLPKYKGEMRNGSDYAILQGTLSSRVYLKSSNTKAQNLLENNIEPLYTCLKIAGADSKYPSDYLLYLWKLLIENHPHDSICGCSKDAVHDHMEDRFERISEAGHELINRGMDFISAHISREGLTNEDYLLTVFNTSERTRDALVELEFQFPEEEEVKSFKIIDSSGITVPFELVSYKKKSKNISSPINLPGSIEVDSYQVKVFIENIRSMGYKVLTVKTSKKEFSANYTTTAKDGNGQMENEFIKVNIHKEGKIDLLYKATGKLYKDILALEDSEDCGDSYVYGKSKNGFSISSSEIKPEITCICNTEFESKYSLVFTMLIPECFDRESDRRSSNLISNKIEVILGLKKGCEWLEVIFNIDNKSKDHRLRALISTEIVGDYSNAASPFDVILRDRREVLKAIKNATEPNSGFIDIYNGDEGIALLNEGLYEYEHLLNKNGTIAITLLRANGLIEVNSKGDAWLVPGNQCIREISNCIGIYPHKGDYITGDVWITTRQFQNPILTNYQPVSLTKFVGGRPAVQDSDIKEIFYRPDPLGHIVLDKENSFVSIKGKGIVLSAVKKSDINDSIIVRVCNVSDEASTFELMYFKGILSASKVNLLEEKESDLLHEGNKLNPIKLSPKEIFTLSLI